MKIYESSIKNGERRNRSQSPVLRLISTGEVVSPLPSLSKQAIRHIERVSPYRSF